MRGKGNHQSKKEKTLMLVSSALVLTALTAAGIYMQEDTGKNADDGYQLDFTKLEQNVPKKNDQIAKNQEVLPEEVMPSIEDDLDYMPLEVDSGKVTIGEDLKDNQIKEEIPIVKPREQLPAESQIEEPFADTNPVQEEMPIAETTGGIRELSFSELEGLIRPLNGDVLIPFSMDSSVYFPTLDQYRYNPALMLRAAEGTEIYACAEGKVKSVFRDAEIGNAVTMELGNGYELTYGQLQEITVAAGEYVDAGQMIAKVAAPTKYFLVEGSNLYLKCTQNGAPVDPSGLFQE